MSKKIEEIDDAFSVKLDMCITDGIIKSSSGLLLGALTSVLFFRRRRWPMIAGTGMGIGLAWANCEFELNNTKKIKQLSKINVSNPVQT